MKQRKKTVPFLLCIMILFFLSGGFALYYYHTHHITAVFTKQEQKEIAVNKSRPECGWFQLYSYYLKPQTNLTADELYYEVSDKDNYEYRLSLVEFNLAEYASSSLDLAAVKNIQTVLTQFQKTRSKVIVRFLYDWDGNGEAKEPKQLTIILKHMKTVAPLLNEYKDIIYTTQGIFVGSWGEMHTSRFLRPDQICLLAQTWQEAMHHALTLSVRKPVHLRMLAGNRPVRGLGLYDDAMFAGADHMGTFGDVPREAADWEEPWCAADEQAYLSGQDENILCGGEALAGIKLSAEAVLEELQKMQVTYLNSIYDPARMAEWKACRLPSGKSLYEEIGSRLGYRICVLCAEWKKGSLWVTLKNEGFSAVCQKTDLLLIRECDEGKEQKVQKVPYEICGLKGGQTDVAKVEIAAGEDDGEGKEEKLYLSMVRKKDGKPLPFANEGAGSRLLIGRWMVQGGLHGREKGNTD